MQEHPVYVENVLQRLAELQRWLGNLNPRQRAELTVDVDRLTDDLRTLFSAGVEEQNDQLEFTPEAEQIATPETSEALAAQAQRQVLDGDELFRSLATNVDLVLWIRANNTDQILYVSPAYEKIWGQTRESLYRAPRSFLDPIHPDDRARVTNEMLEHRQGGVDTEYRIIAPDGALRWIQARTFPVSGRRGATARVAGVAQDITGQKAAEETLRVTLTRMRERYLISRRIGAARSADDVVNAVRSLTPLQHASRLSVLVFDQPWEDVPPARLQVLVDWRGDSSLPALPEEGVAFALHPFSHLFARDASVLVGDVQRDTRLSDDARSRLALNNTRSLLLFPLVTSSQWYGMLNLHFTVPTFVEAGDREYYEKVVYQAAAAIYNFHLLEAETLARKEAERANEAKFHFLAMISHELRTPLTSIKGFATTLLAEDVTWDATSERDFLETINLEADKLTDLIEQLLDLSRLESGTLRIMQEQRSLSSIVAATRSQLEAISSEHELVVEVAEDLPPVMADALRIGQVLTNLVGNACKFAPAGTLIRISAMNLGAQLQVNIADRGPGIALEEREHVFESFYQMEQEGRTRRARGVGLGLAICRGLIDAHGGRIWIQDQAAGGTVVSFTLPLVVKEANPYSG